MSKKSVLYNTLVMLGILSVTVLLAELMHRAGAEPQSTLLVYVLSVLIISCVTPQYVYGIVAALFATFTYDLLVTTPRLGFSFTIGYPITLLTMLLVTFITSTLTIQIKNQAKVALERENHTNLLYEINQKLLAARDRNTIVHLTMEYLVSHLGHSAVFYLGDPTQAENGVCYDMPCGIEGTGAFHTDEERKRVHRIFQSGGFDPAKSFDDYEPQVAYAPVASKGRMLGLIGISSQERGLSESDRTFLQMLVGQVALALELQLLSDEKSRTLVDAEKEKMRSTLLRAISHDLRTPLTSILGASTTLLEQEGIEEAPARGLVSDIKDNAQWLIRMVENILTITKIPQDTMKVNKTMEAAEEVVAQSVAIVRKRFPDWQFHVRVPEELLMVPMDATLISQVLINLLENAVKNSESGALILVGLKKQDRMARFDISDNGRGIPEQVLDNLFEDHTHGQNTFVDSVRGIGIGLSICQAIVLAHGGKIEGHNRKEGGAKFTFFLPLPEEEAE